MEQSRWEEKWSNTPGWIWAVLLFAVALAVRSVHLTAQDIAGDEPFSIFMAQFDLPFIIHYLSTGNNPPLFEVLLHVQMKFFGDDPVAVRLLPTFFGALTVVPLFLAGDRFFNRKVAVAASLLLTFSVQHIRFSHEVRVYSLLSLLMAASLLCFLHIVKRPERWMNWLALAIIDLAMLYAHYLTFYVLMTQLLLVLVFVAWRAQLRNMLLAVGVVLIGYLPFLRVMLERFTSVSQSGTWVPSPGWGESYGAVNLMLNDRITTVVVVLILTIGAVVGMLKGRGEPTRFSWSKDRMLVVVLLWFIVPYVATFLVSKFHLPMFTERYVLHTSVPLYLVVAVLVHRIWAALNPMLGLAGLVLASVFTSDLNPPNNRDLAGAVQYIRAQRTDSTTVYVSPEMFHLGVAYHYDREVFRQTAKPEPFRALDSSLAAQNIHFIRSADQLDLQAPHLLYLDAASEFVHPENGILDRLRAERTLIDSVHFHQIFDVYRFR